MLRFASRSALCLLLLANCAAPKAETAQSLSAEIAEIMVSHHAHDQAVPLVQRGLAADPNNPRMHVLMGIILRDRGLFKEAQRELETAFHLEPRDLDTLAGLGVLFDMQGQGELGEQWHRRAIALGPERAELYNNLGFSLYLRHRDAEAVDAFRQALERDPASHRAYNNLGFTLARQGKYEDALRAFQVAGTKGSALANLGLAYELSGDNAAARSYYEAALKVDRTLKVARANLASLNASPTDAPPAAASTPQLVDTPKQEIR